ncbi:MAG: hypothetical protein HC802_12945 [Caldilineaceae bacterium]|nr:hypothetical protein [Caldilineaceae bacterium]
MVGTANFPGWNDSPSFFRFFVSPWGTGSSRYADVLATGRGLFASWEQAQADGSQPLVGNFLEMERVDHLLGKSG